MPPSEIEKWVDDGRKGLENALRAKPLDIKEQYERQIKELQEAYGEAMFAPRARKARFASGLRRRVARSITSR